MAKREIYSADLVMTKIHNSGVRFRVERQRGVKILDLHHVIIDRDSFPRDDNFSLGFIDGDIKPAEMMKKPDKDASQKKIQEYNDFMVVKEATDKIMKKQKDFMKFKKYKIVINEI